jgi:protein translocase SecG subunit
MEPEELRKLLKKAAVIAAFFALALVFYALRWRGALVVYVLVVGILSVLAILIQSGRGGGLAASLGGLGGDSLLGTHSATPIAKATYVMLGLFVFVCMLAARLGAQPEVEAGFMREAEPAPLLPMPGAGERQPKREPAQTPEGGSAPAGETTPAPGGPLADD